MNLEKSKIGIIGLGYVGLPLAGAFSEKYPVIGFDINLSRVNEVLTGLDSTLELEKDKLQDVIESSSQLIKGLFPTDDPSELASCNIYIVTVPAPTDKHKRPVLTPMVKLVRQSLCFYKKAIL